MLAFLGISNREPGIPQKEEAPVQRHEGKRGGRGGGGDGTDELELDALLIALLKKFHRQIRAGPPLIAFDGFGRSQ